ncbi:hypothetical protein F5X99DRAFT_389417 [Biscogniauxia marginata]|nr:hypothetical protein F5X99DRAFT_389417 [Biscogniauxia marginata]
MSLPGSERYKLLKHPKSRIKKKPIPPVPIITASKKNHLLLYVKNIDEVVGDVDSARNAVEPALLEAVGSQGYIGADFADAGFWRAKGEERNRDDRAVPIRGNKDAGDFLAEFDETIDYGRDVVLGRRDRVEQLVGPYIANGKSTETLNEMCVFWAKEYFKLRYRTLNTRIRDDVTMGWSSTARKLLADSRRDQISSQIHVPSFSDDVLWCLAEPFDDSVHETAEYYEAIFGIQIREASRLRTYEPS